MSTLLHTTANNRVTKVKKTQLPFFICTLLLVLGLVGCSSSKSSASNHRLPKKAVEYLKNLDLKDDVASYTYREDMRWKHPLYAMGFANPDSCWMVETKDSTTICFSPQGEWVYTIINPEVGDLNTKYLAGTDNYKTLLSTCKNIEGAEVRIVGVAKDGNKWVIAAYKTHDIYAGPPTYHYFHEGFYVNSIITL